MLSEENIAPFHLGLSIFFSKKAQQMVQVIEIALNFSLILSALMDHRYEYLGNQPDRDVQGEGQPQVDGAEDGESARRLYRGAQQLHLQIRRQLTTMALITSHIGTGNRNLY
jgi:hypothetical protein